MDAETERLRAEIESLRTQLADASDALRAIRSGEVDALVVQTPDGERVFALESAYEQYRVFLENMEQGAATLTPDGLILYANSRLAAIVGVPHPRLVGASAYQVFGEAHARTIRSLLGDVSGRAREAEIVLMRADGRTVHTYVAVTVMPDGMRCAVVTDLTERVRLHEVLASHEWLRVTLTSIGDAVLSCDVEGRITFLNPVAEAVTGWSEREAAGRPIQDVFRVINEDTREPAEDLVARVLRDGTVAALANHTAIVTRAGREVSIEDSAAPIRDAAGRLAGVVLVFHDVTEKRAARRALANSQARLASVLNSITNGYYALDDEWRFVAANRMAERHFGMPGAALLGTNIWEVTAAGPDSIHYQRFSEAKRTCMPVHFEARSSFRPDFWAEMHVYPLDGGLEVYFADISERKKAEESLRHALIDLESARLSAERAKAAADEASHAKDHFLAVLSHELRTPLSPVLTGISLLQAGEALSARGRGYLDVVRRNVELEARLIDDLLDLTRIARGRIQMNKEAVLLGSVIDAAVEVCRPDIEARGLHFGADIEGPAERFTVEADPARLQQVIWNLLKNAVKFTPKGGCVGVRCREEGGQAVVEVNDSGIGIEAAMLPRVFDAFAQAEASLARQFGGLGLGLAISKALVELHGGTIEAHSEGLDKGTVFRVRLPLAKAERLATPAVTMSDSSAGAPRRRLRILLVDDHGDTIDMLSTILESEGHEVRTAGDVATALETAAQAEFDLLLSDLGLPDRSGLDLMRELRARGLKMPGIALSGYGHERDMEQSRAAGFSEHVVKPAEPRVLLRTIEKVARRVGASQ